MKTLFVILALIASMAPIASAGAGPAPDPLDGVMGTILLQRRSQGDHGGSEVAVFLKGTQVGQALTESDGTFPMDLGPGNYQLRATRTSWLAKTEFFSIPVRGGRVDLATMKLLAGDANGDGEVGGRDLGLVRRSRGRPLVEGVADFNNDRKVNGRDVAAVRADLGRQSDPRCGALLVKDPNGPLVRKVDVTIHPNNNLIMDFGVRPQRVVHRQLWRLG